MCVRWQVWTRMAEGLGTAVSRAEKLKAKGPAEECVHTLGGVSHSYQIINSAGEETEADIL